MEYTILVLSLLGLFGVLVHNLLNLDKINRRNKGELKLSEYYKLERFSIALSICVVIVGVIVSQEIRQIQIAGKWFGVTMFAIGYMSQSILVAFRGRAEKFLKSKEDE